MLILAGEAANSLAFPACLLIIMAVTRFIHRAHRQLGSTLISVIIKHVQGANS